MSLTNDKDLHLEEQEAATPSGLWPKHRFACERSHSRASGDCWGEKEKLSVLGKGPRTDYSL